MFFSPHVVSISVCDTRWRTLISPTDHKPWKVIFIETKVIISSPNPTWKQMYSYSYRVKMAPFSGESTWNNCWSVLLCGPSADQTHTVWMACVTLYDQTCGFWPCAAVLYLAFFLFKNIKQYFQPAPQAPSSITIWGCERSEWRWFRHLGASGAALGSPWNHKPAQVTLKFVAFRFLHSSGTKWSLNLVI